jgi:hypothetical protein
VKNRDVGEVEELRQWAITADIKHTHLNALLRILRKRLLPQLPKSSKTFLQTASAQYKIEVFMNLNDEHVGEFVYYGKLWFITEHLQRIISPQIYTGADLHLQFNIDGLPLFKSSNQQLWPILCKVHYEPGIYQPFPMAIYAGKEKPTNLNKYFKKFIEELSSLLRNEIMINDRAFNVYVDCFICDRLARSLIKCIKNHGGYYACEQVRFLERGIQVALFTNSLVVPRELINVFEIKNNLNIIQAFRH